MLAGPRSPLSLASREEQHSLQSLTVLRGLAAPSTGQQYPACMGQDETLSRKRQVLRVDVLSPKGGRAAPRRGLYPPAGFCRIQLLVKLLFAVICTVSSFQRELGGVHPTLLCSKGSCVPQSFSQRQERMAQS